MSTDDQIEAGAARARLAVLIGFKGEVSDADLMNAAADAIERLRCEIPPFAAGVGRALSDALPVLEAAVARAEMHDGAQTGLDAAVNAFGGGGQLGIMQAVGRLEAWRDIAERCGSLVVAMRPIIAAYDEGSLEHIVDPSAEDAATRRREVARAFVALRWFVGMEEHAFVRPQPVPPEVLELQDRMLRRAAAPSEDD